MEDSLYKACQILNTIRGLFERELAQICSDRPFSLTTIAFELRECTLVREPILDAVIFVHSEGTLRYDESLKDEILAYLHNHGFSKGERTVLKTGFKCRGTLRIEQLLESEFNYLKKILKGDQL